jgi:translation initiation factor IF-3
MVSHALRGKTISSMDVKTKKVAIIPVGQKKPGEASATPSSAPASPIRIGKGAPTGGIKIGTGVSIGSRGPSGGGGFPPRPGGFSRGPRRDLSKFNTDEHRINERIRVPQVRLIDQNGEQVGVVDTTQALQMARDATLDLVEISPNAAPPVCKILDYGKFKYEKKKKDQEAKKKQVVVKVKEVQLRPNTDEHDLDYKFRNVRSFLEDGDKAKITMMFRGREVAYVENGQKTMRRLIQEMGDLAIVEAPPKLEGKKLIMVLGPNPKAKKTPSANKEKAPKPAEPAPEAARVEDPAEEA